MEEQAEIEAQIARAERNDPTLVELKLWDFMVSFSFDRVLRMLSTNTALKKLE